MNTEEKKYWEKVYTKEKLPTDPSPFAKFLMEHLREGPFDILDLGCGNGRDSYYFASLGHKVYGVDTSNCPEKRKNAGFEQADMVTFDKAGYDILYSRFTFHSITDEKQDELLDSVQPGQLIAIETRSVVDKDIKKVFGDDHFRNYSGGDELKKRMESHGFSIMHFCESRGLAKYKDEDPMVIRILAMLKLPSL